MKLFPAMLAFTSVVVISSCSTNTSSAVKSTRDLEANASVASESTLNSSAALTAQKVANDPHRRTLLSCDGKGDSRIASLYIIQAGDQTAVQLSVGGSGEFPKTYYYLLDAADTGDDWQGQGFDLSTQNGKDYALKTTTGARLNEYVTCE